MGRIKNKIQNTIRQIIISDITNNFGIVEIYDDKIICYVDNKNLKKIKKGQYLPTYQLFFNSKKMYSQETLELYKLNKPIHYVIDGMNFNNALIVIGPEDSVHFKNCTFNDEINISTSGQVIFENNKYVDKYGLYTTRNNLFFNVIADEGVTFINDNYINDTSSICYYRPTFNFDVRTKKLTIENSTFKFRRNDGNVNIKTDNLVMNGSDIKCDKPINISAHTIDSYNSSIESNSEINIKNQNLENPLKLISPKIIVNDIDMTKYSVINNDSVNLQKSRIELVKQLKKLRDFCVEENLKSTKVYENTLNERSVVKTIKK